MPSDFEQRWGQIKDLEIFFIHLHQGRLRKWLYCSWHMAEEHGFVFHITGLSHLPQTSVYLSNMNMNIYFFPLYGLKMCASQKYFLRDNIEEATYPCQNQSSPQWQQALNCVHQSMTINLLWAYDEPKWQKKEKNTSKFRYQKSM